MNAYSAHMETAFWKDPENFRPERFLDRDNKIINSARVISFGLGELLLVNVSFSFGFVLMNFSFRFVVDELQVMSQIAY